MFKKLFKAIYLIYIIVECTISVQQHLGYHRGDKEMYTLMHGRSDLLLDYSNYPDLDQYEKMDRIESVFTNCKYDSPVSTWLHTQGAASDKITVLYPSYQQPGFVLSTYFWKFRHLSYLDKDLRIKYEPYMHSYQVQKEMI